MQRKPEIYCNYRRGALGGKHSSEQVQFPRTFPTFFANFSHPNTCS